MEKDRALARTFGTEAAAYDRGRPGYPADAVEWILTHAATDDGALPDVVDLGAGTGKFTAGLVGRAASVTAVEPDALMRERLETNLPGVVAIDGSAERIPLGDDSADVVTMAQAWHWVDVPASSTEIARILRPGGVLALVWNVRDTATSWVQDLTEVIGSSIAEEFDTVEPPLGEALTRDAYAEFRWSNPVDRDALVALVASRSSVIAMDETERTALWSNLDALLTTHPDLAGRTVFDLPYVTRVTIARAF